MTDKEVATIAHKAFSVRLNQLTLKARSGGTKGNAAALLLMREMTAENIVLRSLGYMVSDSGRIKKFKSFLHL